MLKSSFAFFLTPGTAMVVQLSGPIQQITRCVLVIYKLRVVSSKSVRVAEWGSVCRPENASNVLNILCSGEPHFMAHICDDIINPNQPNPTKQNLFFQEITNRDMLF